MPIFYAQDRLCYFAHVPKCAGTAVEYYLRARFGSLGMQDSAFLKVELALRWTRSSPQHIDVAALNRLLPQAFFKASFAMVRHPVRRLESVFLFQRDIERNLPVTTGFGTFLTDLEEQMRHDPFYLDNHPRPMSDLIPDDATVFRVEDGTDAVVHWLDELAGDSLGPREIETFNSYSQRLDQMQRDPGPEPRITPENCALIAEIYAQDFKRFGYDIDDILQDGAVS